jgi:hypothetical protein
VLFAHFDIERKNWDVSKQSVNKLQVGKIKFLQSGKKWKRKEEEEQKNQIWIQDIRCYNERSANERYSSLGMDYPQMNSILHLSVYNWIY